MTSLNCGRVATNFQKMQDLLAKITTFVAQKVRRCPKLKPKHNIFIEINKYIINLFLILTLCLGFSFGHRMASRRLVGARLLASRRLPDAGCQPPGRWPLADKRQLQVTRCRPLAAGGLPRRPSHLISQSVSSFSFSNFHVPFPNFGNVLDDI